MGPNVPKIETGGQPRGGDSDEVRPLKRYKGLLPGTLSKRMGVKEQIILIKLKKSCGSFLPVAEEITRRRKNMENRPQKKNQTERGTSMAGEESESNLKGRPGGDGGRGVMGNSGGTPVTAERREGNKKRSSRAWRNNWGK